MPLGLTARLRRAKAGKRLRDYKKACAQVDKDSGGENGYVPCARCGRWVQRPHHHHIQLRSRAPELRTVASNIGPLCADCHLKAHASQDWTQGHLRPVTDRIERE